MGRQTVGKKKKWTKTRIPVSLPHMLHLEPEDIARDKTFHWLGKKYLTDRLPLFPEAG